MEHPRGKRSKTCGTLMVKAVRRSTNGGFPHQTVDDCWCHLMRQLHNWLVVDLHLWKMMEWKSVGMMTFPIYGKIKNVPNHQPNNHLTKTKTLRTRIWFMWVWEQGIPFQPLVSHHVHPCSIWSGHKWRIHPRFSDIPIHVVKTTLDAAFFRLKVTHLHQFQRGNKYHQVPSHIASSSNPTTELCQIHRTWNKGLVTSLLMVHLVCGICGMEFQWFKLVTEKG